MNSQIPMPAPPAGASVVNDEEDQVAAAETAEDAPPPRGRRLERCPWEPREDVVILEYLEAPSRSRGGLLLPPSVQESMMFGNPHAVDDETGMPQHSIPEATLMRVIGIGPGRTMPSGRVSPVHGLDLDDVVLPMSPRPGVVVKHGGKAYAFAIAGQCMAVLDESGEKPTTVSI